VLTCAVNFGCATDQEVGFGDWPECGCSPIEEAGGTSTLGGGDGTPGEIGLGVGGGLGGVPTCEEFFDCPSGAKMEVQHGRCSCTLIMLPEFRE
jgi:hypothetical protein